eukprot:CAMPEP_0117653794 /NCGR_PEP_ID=MMETSP0804-20121206/3390_1 /TAXON_ID=1074897 /ORGANISM="Tetraselmis astigmatica, Strain CCMP880" /LENGTH=1079 /DNA_ID=CAMNT_0005460011 /DNA_START=223 /DNA_END=3463 /DNA_ORIENTATION=-
MSHATPMVFNGEDGGGGGADAPEPTWRRAPSDTAAPRLPRQLPLVPLYNAVLLPLGFLRVRIPASSSRGEVQLVKHLQKVILAGAEGFAPPRRSAAAAVVAAVPVVNTPVAVDISGQGSAGEVLPPPTGSWTPTGAPGKRHLFPLGTAALVVQVSKTKHKGEPAWDLLLEGVCRLRIGHVDQVDSGMYTVQVQQLDGVVASDSEGGSRGASLEADSGTAPSDKELVEQLKDISDRLLQSLRSVFASQQKSQEARRRSRSSKNVLAATERLKGMLRSLPPARAADLLASALADTTERLAVLSAVDVNKRIQLAIALATGALRSLGRANSVRLVGGSGDSEGEGGPEEDEEGDGDAAAHRTGQDDNEAAALRARLKAANPPPEILEAGIKEVAKLERMGEQHPGAAGVRSYVELIADLPWAVTAASLAEAAAATPAEGAAAGKGPQLRAIKHLDGVKTALDEAHKGLDKVKQRILEYVAVSRLVDRDSAPGPILCFIGPPGVGKTSLADSIASVLGRPLARIALGGVRDESEIRGHRRTYIGAMPGRILQGLRRCKCKDPVMLLDEVDKMGHDVRGDPTAALLEVLDPAQNHAFVDTFLSMPFDLSKVVFVATANEEGAIPAPLRDRMEIIRLSGYTVEERVAIAQAHLLPRVLRAHGLPPGTLELTPPVMEALIRGWTREAGVRDLERKLAAVARHVALKMAKEQEATQGLAGTADSHQGGSVLEAALPGGETGSGGHAAAMGTGIPGSDGHLHHHQYVVDEELLVEVLGPKRFTGHEAEERVKEAGTATGLVWTPVGGSVQFVEACMVSRGRHGREGTLTLTGQLGGVLEESARIALSWCRSNALRLGLLQPDPNDQAEAEGDYANLAGAPASRPTDAQRRGTDLPPVHQHLYHDPQAVRISSSALSPHSGGSSGSGGSFADHMPPIHVEEEEEAPMRPRAAGRGVNGPLPPPVLAADVHIHFPAGGIPKDGPSAGITLACALISLFSGKHLRGDVAMTGEVTLRGLVLPVGGIKEKLLAAKQAGMATVLLPARNLPDVEFDLPSGLLEGLQVVPVSNMDAVLAAAFPGGYPVQSASRL